MGHQLARRNELVNWQVAPAEYEISNYDEPKINYRRHVENIINSCEIKSLRKRPFFTISTNVLCADLTSSRDDIDPVDRDLYLPLEIVITKWSLSDSKIELEDRDLKTKVWMINPGEATSGSVSKARDHQEKTHKIKFDASNQAPNQFIEPDLSKVLKEINAFLTQDRTVYSGNLLKVRQDLGSLKWLNRNTGYRTKPINVYSLEDLYVVLIRRFLKAGNDPSSPEAKSQISQGIARSRIDSTIYNNVDAYDNKCDYHQLVSNLGEECNCCAKALCWCYSNTIVDDVAEFGEVFSDLPESPKKKSPQALGKENIPSEKEGPTPSGSDQNKDPAQKSSQSTHGTAGDKKVYKV